MQGEGYNIVIMIIIILPRQTYHDVSLYDIYIYTLVSLWLLTAIAGIWSSRKIHMFNALD